jgi:hypothetical protein
VSGSLRDVWAAQLAEARDVLARHYIDGQLCACLRRPPCPVAARFTEYALGKAARIQFYDMITGGPTVELPAVEARQSA